MLARHEGPVKPHSSWVTALRTAVARRFEAARGESVPSAVASGGKEFDGAEKALLASSVLVSSRWFRTGFGIAERRR
jgi:hypothetical protein